MARMQPPVVAIVGESEHREFAAALAWLNEQTRLYPFPTCQAANEAIRAGDVLPSWIILAAAHRSTFNTREVERLHRRAPHTRLVTLLGSWCEGETRSGLALPGVSRVYWHEFVTRAPLEMLGPSRSGYACWWLPRSATPVDLALTIERRGPRKTSHALDIVAPTRERYEALADAAAACGCSANWLRDPTEKNTSAAALLYDSDSLSESVAVELRHLLSTQRKPVVALLPFPRQQEIVAAKALGVTSIIAKPFLLGDLGTHLAHILPAKKRVTAA